MKLQFQCSKMFQLTAVMLMLLNVHILWAQPMGCCPTGYIQGPNLVTNGDFEATGPVPTGFTSQLNPSTNCGPGEYYITTNFSSWCTGWPNLSACSKSKFLVVDGRDAGGPAYVWRNSVNLTSNTDYTFSFCWASVYPSPSQSFPLSFDIVDANGTPLSGSPAIQTIIAQNPVGSWVTRTFCFNSGSFSGSHFIALRQMAVAARTDFGIDNIGLTACTIVDCCDDFHNSFNGVNFTYSNTPPSNSYNFFAPAVSGGNDIYSWDFGDNSALNPNQFPIHNYSNPGTYMVCLTIKRILANRDTCKITLCQLLTINPCDLCKQSILQNNVDVCADFGSWTPGVGPVTFYPVTQFSPFNVSIDWDFNCDGIIDQVSSGNAPVNYNFTCGFHTVCYTVKCLISQQSDCDKKSYYKAFSIPCCPVNKLCSDIVKNGDFENGNSGFTSALVGGPNCTCSSNSYCVANNAQVKCAAFINLQDHTYQNGGGSFLIIDGADVNNSTIVWQTSPTVSLTVGQSYEFTFWAANARPGESIDLEMLINGVPVKLVTSTSQSWKEYSYIWNAAPGVNSIAIRQVSAGAFRDFALDDITVCEIDCLDFMTDAMDYGIIGTGISGNNYQFCLSPNISPNDIFLWDLDCNGTIDASTPCATFPLTPNNHEICVTVLHIKSDGDTCRVKLNHCLPDLAWPDTCSCDPKIFIADVLAGFTEIINTATNTVTLTPNALLTNCDKVNWTFGDNSPSVNSIGNASVSHTYTSSPSGFVVCMHIVRTTPTGDSCKENICKTLVKAGLVESKAATIVVAPNPTTNAVVVTVPQGIEFNDSVLELRGLDGKLKNQILIKSENTTLELGLLPAGLYFISIVDYKGRQILNPVKILKL